MRRPRYPVFVPTKGRWDSRWTIRAFDNIGLDYRAVIEPQEVERYVEAGVSPDRVLETPHRDEGLVATRNFIWDYAESLGVERFWTFDDNIGTNVDGQGVVGLYRFNRNVKTPCVSSTPLAILEDFVERYENVPIAGFNYFMFASRKTTPPAFYRNTRVYSNMLIETNALDRNGRPYRNEGFYNDDTDLCLRVLKDGYATVLLNAFLIYKRTTMTVGGGMTPHYLGDGRYEMARELAEKHPDVTKITRKWGRWQHHVDYSGFRQKLRLREGVEVPDGVDDFGLVYQQRVDDEWWTLPTTAIPVA